MNNSFEQYMRSLAEISEARRSPKATVRAVEQAKRALLARGLSLEERVRATNGDRHGRHLLHLDPHSGFVVIVMAWPAGGDSLPHDHGTWGTVGVLEGTLQVTTYDRMDDGSDPLRAELMPTCTLRAEQGAVASVLPPHDEYHRIENPTGSLALSLHTYGREITRCHSYDLVSGAGTVEEPIYTSRP
jgi:predicted metal-dependent enzyme (double-stranded beta helix superfamily)